MYLDKVVTKSLVAKRAIGYFKIDEDDEINC